MLVQTQAEAHIKSEKYMRYFGELILAPSAEIGPIQFIEMAFKYN